MKWAGEQGRVGSLFRDAVAVIASFKVRVESGNGTHQIANCLLDLVFSSDFLPRDLSSPERCEMHGALGLYPPSSVLSEMHFCFNIIIIRKDDA